MTLKGTIDSRQTLQAFDQLKGFVEKRKNWNLGISPNSSRYLKQQIERLYGQYLELITQENNLEHPLKTFQLQRRYRELLPLEITPEEQAAKEKTQDLGVHQCTTLDNNSSRAENLRLYAVAFCKVLGNQSNLGTQMKSSSRINY